MHGWALGVLGAGLAAVVSAPAFAAGEVNIYSSRHYSTDEAFYAGFSEQTGIKINRIDGKADELIERIQAEGDASPADILITVDAGRLWRAAEAGILEPVRSDVLESSIPTSLRHPDGLWYGFSKRARVIVYDPSVVDPGQVQSYEDLASPANQGLVCIRSSSNIYQLSLMASLIDNLGEAAAQQWAEDVVGNFARDPEGNDTAQIKSVAAGECGIGVANSYYLARLGNSEKVEDQNVFNKVGVVFPNQDSRGAHVNISGAGVVKGSPNADNALKFLEYMAGDEAQVYFANGNNEYAVVDGVAVDNPALAKLGDFKADSINVDVLGKNQAKAQLLYDIAGWR